MGKHDVLLGAEHGHRLVVLEVLGHVEKLAVKSVCRLANLIAEDDFSHVAVAEDRRREVSLEVRVLRGKNSCSL